MSSTTGTEILNPKRLNQLAGAIKRAREESLALAGRCLEKARYVGELLNEAKTMVPHGDWLPWLEENFPGSERAARGYMRLSSNWEALKDKTAETADLTLDGALKLLATPRATPEPEPETETDAPADVDEPNEPHEKQESSARRARGRRHTPEEDAPAEPEPRAEPNTLGLLRDEFLSLAGKGHKSEVIGTLRLLGNIPLVEALSGALASNSPSAVACFVCGLADTMEEEA